MRRHTCLVSKIIQITETKANRALQSPQCKCNIKREKKYVQLAKLPHRQTHKKNIRVDTASLSSAPAPCIFLTFFFGENAFTIGWLGVCLLLDGTIDFKLLIWFNN